MSSATGLTFVYHGGTTILPGRGNDRYPAGTGLVDAWAKPGQSKDIPKGDSGLAGKGGMSWGYAKDSKGSRAGMITKGARWVTRWVWNNVKGKLQIMSPQLSRNPAVWVRRTRTGCGSWASRPGA